MVDYSSVSKIKNDNKKGYKFFLFIPLINAIAYVTAGLYEVSIYNTGILRAIIVVSFLFWYYVFVKKEHTKSEVIINTFLIYLFVLTIFSSNVFFSFSIFLKVFLSMTLFGVGYYYVTNLSKLGQINNIYTFVLAIFIISVLLAIFFGFGDKGYGGSEDIYLGATGPNIAKNIVIIILIFPAILLINFKEITKKKKIIITILFTVGIILVLIMLKRSALLALILGLIIYLVFSYNKFRSFRIIFIASVLIIISSPFYIDKLYDTFDARSRSAFIGREGEFEEEARYLEIFSVYNNFLKEDISHQIFGSELFNDREYFKSRRMLHTDYAILWNGAGVIGLFLYLLIPIVILLQIRKSYKANKNEITKELFAIAISIIFSSYILGYSGSITNLDIRSLIFLYLGAILKVVSKNISYQAAP